MKFLGHLRPLDGDTSAIDFGPDMSNPLAGDAPKVKTQRIRLFDRLETLEACLVIWGVASYQLLRQFVNPFIK